MPKKSKEVYLNEIPNSWDEIKGKYIFKQRNEKGGNSLVLLSPTQKYGVIPQELYEELSGMSAVKVNEKTNLSSFKTIKKGDYCISLRSFEGGFEYCIYDGVVSPAYTVFYCAADGDQIYYKYLFKTGPFIREMNSYSLSLRDGKPIAYDTFGNTCVPLPPLAEQKAIADFLDKKCGEIDEITKIIEEQIDTLEKYKKSIIAEATTKGLNASVELKDSGISWVGPIPSHWKLMKNRYIFTKKKEIVGADWENTQLLSLTKKGVVCKNIDDGGGKQPESFSTYQVLKKDDIIMCLFDLDVSAVFSGLSQLDGMISPAYKRFVCGKGFLNRYFKYYFDFVFSGRYYKFYSKNLRYTVDDDVFDSLFSLVPPLVEQKAIADFLDKKCGEIDKIISAKREELAKIDSYKKSLIYEYVTGKKEVAQSEAN